MTEQVHKPAARTRIGILLLVIFLVPVGLSVRAFDLHVTNKDFLQSQGDARSLRPVPVIAHRGKIMDRHGEPLAVSTPVDSIWAHPQHFKPKPAKLAKLAKLLNIKSSHVKKLIKQKRQAGKEFVYLKRRISPSLSQKVMQLDIDGVSSLREYRRYYPMGEVASHVIGFTNVDDIGQEGIELTYNDWLQGINGSQLVMTDNDHKKKNIIKTVASLKAARPGNDLVLSIDRRIQYMAYRELKRAVFEHKAKSASAVVLDVTTGEILAMVNQPSFNPNNREEFKSYRYRNRVVTDTFEPGSTIKPFTIIAGLETKRFNRNTVINTAPGYMKVGRNLVRDIRNYGQINLSTLLQKSSNVGASKIALAMKPQRLLDLHKRIGFGDLTQSALSGEASGFIHEPRKWRDIERATLSYGYGLSVTTLQLARAYSVIASNGYIKPVTIQLQTTKVRGEQVIDAKYVKQVRDMLKTVVADGGTATKAQILGYLVAGKTGTAKKLGKNGYSDDRYISTFVGMAPADNPRLVMAITIHEPRGEHYYGGEVAGPAFSRTVGNALRLLDVSPDVIPTPEVNFAWATEGRP